MAEPIAVTLLTPTPEAVVVTGGQALAPTVQPGTPMAVTLTQSPTIAAVVTSTPQPVAVTLTVGGQGPPGVGVPEGGTAGQALVKHSSTNYDTEWKAVTTYTGTTPVVVSGTEISLKAASITGSFLNVEGTPAAGKVIGYKASGSGLEWTTSGNTYTGVTPIVVSGAEISLAAEGITTGFIATGAITSTRIAEEGVNTSNIAVAAVSTGKLEAGAVTKVKLAAKAVSESNLAEALLGPAANVFGLRKLGTGALEAMPGNTPLGGPPSGAAGGALTGTYPNPTLRDFATVKDYGAKGDGVTDDTAACAEAITKVGANGTLVWPAGIYLVKSALKHNQVGQRWVSFGATIKLANASNVPAVELSAEEGVIEGALKIDGNSANQTSNNTGLYINGAAKSKTTIEVVNARGKGIVGEPSSGVEINGRVINSTEAGVWLKPKEHVDVTDLVVNVFVDKSSQAKATAKGYGVQIIGNVEAGKGYIQNPRVTAIVKLPSSPTETMIGVELENVRDGRCDAITTGGTMGISLNTCVRVAGASPVVRGAKTYAIEFAASTDCEFTGVDIDGEEVTERGVEWDGPTPSTRCSITGGHITGTASYPCHMNKADSPLVANISGKCGKQFIYCSETPHLQVIGGRWLGAGAESDAIVLEGKESSGAVIDGISPDGFTRSMVAFYSAGAVTIDDVHIGIAHPTNMVGVPVTIALGAAVIGSKVTYYIAPHVVAGGDLEGTYPNPTLAANTVTSTEINVEGTPAAGKVIGYKATGTGLEWTTGGTTYTGTEPVVVTGSVISLKAEGITTALIATGAVTSTRIAEEGVNTSNIAVAAVSTGKLETEAVTALKLAANAVTTTKIAAEAVTEPKLASALLGPAAGSFGLRKLGVGPTEARAGNMPWKDPVSVVTAAALPAYAQSGSGATGTLEATANGALTIDGVAMTVGTRVLVKNAVLTKHNGIYEVIQAGGAAEKWKLTRTAGANTGASLENAMVFAHNGTANAGVPFTCSTTGAITVDTTALTWVEAGNVNLTGAQPLTGTKTITKIVGVGGYGGTGAINNLHELAAQIVQARGYLKLGASIGEENFTEAAEYDNFEAQHEAVFMPVLWVAPTPLVVTLTGWKCLGKANEEELLLFLYNNCAVGSGRNLVLSNENAKSEAVNQFSLGVASLTLEPHQSAIFIRQGGKWRLATTTTVLEGVVGTAQLLAEAVTAAKIATGAITEVKLGAESVSEGKIKTEAVTAGKIATNAVEEAKIKEGAVTEVKLGAEAVSASKIKTDAVETVKIKALAVTEAKLAEEAVSGKKLKVGAPEATKELKANTKIKGITGSSTMVYLSVLLKAESTEGEVIADGKPVYKLLKETLATSSKVLYFSFKMKAGAEFELKLALGALESTTSVYVLQEG